MAKKVNEEEEVKTSKQIKELVIIALVVAGIFLLIWLMTVGANKMGWFDERYTKPAVPEAVISYENIEVGTILDRAENEYYVVLADLSKNAMNIETLISAYKSKENATKVYTVDLSEGLNRSVVGEEANTNVTKVSDLKVNDTTLLHIRNGKITASYIGEENIETILK